MFSLILSSCTTQAQVKRVLQHVAKADRDYEVLVADYGGLEKLGSTVPYYNLKVIDTGFTPAQQKNQLAAAAQHPWLVFLPAGAVPAKGFETEVNNFIARPEHEQRIGVFRFAIDSEVKKARRVERMAAFFNRLGFCGGRQGIIIHRSLFDMLGGFFEMGGFEEADILMRSKPVVSERFCVLPSMLALDAARYEKEGYYTHAMRRMGAMYLLLLKMPPETIKKTLPRLGM